MVEKEKTSRLDRALQERMYFISHIPPSSTTRAHNVLVTGQSGNLYTVTLPIDKQETAQCNCIDQRIRRTLCKHMLFTLLRVLKIPRERLPTTDHNTIPKLTRSLLPVIQESFRNIQCGEVAAPDQVQGVIKAMVPGVLGVRERVERRVVDKSEECPICYEEFSEESLVYCDFGCGNGVHEDCFKQYCKAINGPPRCVLCRAIWERNEENEIGKRGLLIGRRLVNVAEVVPQAFDGVRVRPLGLDKNGKKRERKRVDKGGSSVLRKKGVEEVIRKGPTERELRMKAREERRRLAERKKTGGRVTRSKSGKSV